MSLDFYDKLINDIRIAIDLIKFLKSRKLEYIDDV